MSGEGDIVQAVIVAIPIAAKLVQIGTDALSGHASPERTVRDLLQAGLDIVPVDVLKQYLTEEAVRRAELAADIAEDAKWPRP